MGSSLSPALLWERRLFVHSLPPEQLPYLRVVVRLACDALRGRGHGGWEMQVPCAADVRCLILRKLESTAEDWYQRDDPHSLEDVWPNTHVERLVWWLRFVGQDTE